MHPPSLLLAGLVALTMLGPFATPAASLLLTGEPTVSPAGTPPVNPFTAQAEAFAGEPPSVTAFGVAVTYHGDPFFGPSPVAQSAGRAGRAEQWADAADVLVHGPDGEKLVEGREVHNVAVTHVTTFAAQGRAMSRIAQVDLLDGTVRAELLEADAFASTNQRNGSWRGDDSASIIGRVWLGSTLIPVSSTTAIPLPLSLGTLYINQSIADAAEGVMAHYSLHLALNSGIDVFVAGVVVHTTGTTATGAPMCMTWSEAYPVQVHGLVADDDAKARALWVPGDIMGAANANGTTGGAPLAMVEASLQADSAWSHHSGAIAGNDTNATISADAATRLVGLRLLGGLVEADVLQSTAHVRITWDGTNYTVHADNDDSRILHLRINNAELDANATASTTIRIPSTGAAVAVVYINETTTENNVSADGVAMAVQRSNALRIVVTATGLGLPVGAEIVLSHAITIAQCGSDEMPPMDFGDPFHPA